MENGSQNGQVKVTSSFWGEVWWQKSRLVGQRRMSEASMRLAPNGLPLLPRIQKIRTWEHSRCEPSGVGLFNQRF